MVSSQLTAPGSQDAHPSTPRSASDMWRTEGDRRGQDVLPSRFDLGICAHRWCSSAPLSPLPLHILAHSPSSPPLCPSTLIKSGLGLTTGRAALLTLLTGVGLRSGAHRRARRSLNPKPRRGAAGFYLIRQEMCPTAGEFPWKKLALEWASGLVDW